MVTDLNILFNTAWPILIGISCLYAAVIFALSRNKKIKEFSILVLSYLFSVYIGVVIAFYIAQMHEKNGYSEILQRLGLTGDFFGGMLNPILAFASFIALLHTIRIQSEELRLTTKELANNVEVQKDIVEQHKTNLLQSKANNKVSFVAPILISKIKEAEEILLQLEGEKSSGFIIPNLWSLYLSALNSADRALEKTGDIEYKRCGDVTSIFCKSIYNNSQTSSRGYELSLTVLQRVLSSSNYYLQQLADDPDIDDFYLSAFEIELQRPAAILFLAGKVGWNSYTMIDMAPFMEGQFITGYPTA